MADSMASPAGAVGQVTSCLLPDAHSARQLDSGDDRIAKHLWRVAKIERLKKSCECN
jgi:hypothetical protein